MSRHRLRTGTITLPEHLVEVVLVPAPPPPPGRVRRAVDALRRRWGR